MLSPGRVLQGSENRQFVLLILSEWVVVLILIAHIFTMHNSSLFHITKSSECKYISVPQINPFSTFSLSIGGGVTDVKPGTVNHTFLHVQDIRLLGAACDYVSAQLSCKCSSAIGSDSTQPHIIRHRYIRIRRNTSSNVSHQPPPQRYRQQSCVPGLWRLKAYTYFIDISIFY